MFPNISIVWTTGTTTSTENKNQVLRTQISWDYGSCHLYCKNKYWNTKKESKTKAKAQQLFFTADFDLPDIDTPIPDLNDLDLDKNRARLEEITLREENDFLSVNDLGGLDGDQVLVLHLSVVFMIFRLWIIPNWQLIWIMKKWWEISMKSLVITRYLFWKLLLYVSLYGP